MNKALHARLSRHSSTCLSPRSVAAFRTTSYYITPSRIASHKTASRPVLRQFTHFTNFSFNTFTYSRQLRHWSNLRSNNVKMADRNGATTTRAKRKQKQPPEAEERPVKQHKISNGTRSNGAVKGDLNQNITTEGPPQKTSRTLNGTDSIEVIKPKISPDIMSVGHEMNGLARVAAVVGTTADAEWQKTIESVVCNVVSIRFCQTCAFDTDPALTSEATGFVVDAERGYV